MHIITQTLNAGAYEIGDDNMTTEERVDQLVEQIMNNLMEIESLGYEQVEDRIMNIAPIHEDLSKLGSIEKFYITFVYKPHKQM